MKWYAISCFLLFNTVALWGQTSLSPVDYDKDRLTLNKKGMYVLGSWALGNMALSGSLLAASSTQHRAFHQMNLGWNTVNLAIAGYGVYQAQQGLANNEWPVVIAEQYQMEKILLFNAGLDLAYMAGGFWMRQKALNSEKADQWRGFGNAVIMNGAFLFAFDLVFYFLHQQHREHELWPLLENLQLGAQGIGFHYSF